MLTRGAAVLFELATFVGGIIATYLLFSGLLPGNSAIQTAATSATAVAFVAIPYALSSIFHHASTRSVMIEQADALHVIAGTEKGD